jgi:hypothetical protein
MTSKFSKLIFSSDHEQLGFGKQLWLGAVDRKIRPFSQSTAAMVQRTGQTIVWFR